MFSRDGGNLRTKVRIFYIGEEAEIRLTAVPASDFEGTVTAEEQQAGQLPEPVRLLR